ncbi:MAG: hypothetical protein PHS54_00105 [Clostridia bacterium]|nr:hypothetical protein [Clostridia bacterium]
MTALIMCRAGSERVPNKNVKKFGNTTLIELKIKQLCCIRNIDDIVISTDDNDVIDIAIKYSIPYMRRPDYYCRNDTPLTELFPYFAQTIKSDTIVKCNVTSPLIKNKSIEDAIDIFKNNSFNSLMSVHRCREFLIQKNKGLNYDITHQIRSQELPLIYIYNNAIDIAKNETIIKQKHFHSKKIYFFEIPEIEGRDIDTQLDFDICEFLYMRNNK